MKDLLFIGGPLDGQKRAVTADTGNYDVDGPPLAHYRRVTLFGGVDIRLDVFALHNMSRMDITQKLITHYQP